MVLMFELEMIERDVPSQQDEQGRLEKFVSQVIHNRQPWQSGSGALQALVFVTQGRSLEIKRSAVSLASADLRAILPTTAHSVNKP